MTRKEKLMQDHPGWKESYIEHITKQDCPGEHGFYEKPGECDGNCIDCWDRKEESPDLVYEHRGEPIAKTEKVDISEEDCEITLKPVIKDSGNRRQFESGAVRDMQEGKGRCDLMPLEVVARFLKLYISPAAAAPIAEIADFRKDDNTEHLYASLYTFCMNAGYNLNHSTMFLEVAKHFEEGAKKYGENNWQKGIPVNCYIDSAVRHYLKWLRGDEDEPHDRAFVWNLMCCIWEVDYREKGEE